jgi:hypothetical protein
MSKQYVFSLYCHVKKIGGDGRRVKFLLQPEEEKNPGHAETERDKVISKLCIGKLYGLYIIFCYSFAFYTHTV